MSDYRLDPVVLRKNAEAMVARSTDHVELVASLLRDIRRNDDIQQAIRRGYSQTSREIEAEVRRAESRAYLHAADHIRRMGPFPSTRVTYQGAKNQAVRWLRGYAKWTAPEDPS